MAPSVRGVRRRPDQHASRRSRGLQAGGGVHDVAHGGVVAAGPQRADEHLARVDADPNADGQVQVGHELGDRTLHPQRRPDSPLGVVLVGHRSPEQGDDGVTEDLVDPPAEARHVLHEPLEQPVDQ